MSDLMLTLEEQAFLAGEHGPGVRRAMEIVVALARIYGAADLVPIRHAQIAGVSYKNLGDAGVAFLHDWAAEGARVRVPTSLNPMGMERTRWQTWGIAESFAGPQLRVIEAFTTMGITPTMSCTPYLFPGVIPHRGDALAWAESSAVAFANSVIGARTNREGGPSAIAAAIVGRTARYGYHLDENRRANCRGGGALSGAFCGRLRRPELQRRQSGGQWRAVVRRPGVQWLPPLPKDLTLGGPAGDRLKTLGAGLAAYGAVAMYHVAGYTPEAQDAGETLLRPDATRIVIESLDDAYRIMDADPDLRHIDLVTVGCPHASLTESAASGRSGAWQTTGDAPVGDHSGHHPCSVPPNWATSQDIEAAGGEVVADTCAVVAPMHMLNVRSMATNAGKMACYAPMHSGVKMRFGDLDACIEAAITGEWPCVKEPVNHE